MTPKPMVDPVERLQRRENQLFLALTIIIGVVAGLSAVLFALAIDAAKHALFGLQPSSLRLVATPALASLVIGWLLVRHLSEARGSGVPQTEAAFHLDQGFIRARVPFGKFLTGVLCIGSGHSLGREGPSVQIGAGLASLVGRWFQLSPGRVRNLVPVGAAGALSAAFNTPVAAVLFALEEIIGDLNAPLIGSTVVASVAAVVVERSILGNAPLFRVPAYELVHPAELLAYAALGIVGGLVSLLFCKGLLLARAAFLRLPVSTRAVQPALGGAAVGVLLIFVPEVMGVGYEYVDQALHGGLALRLMLVLGLAKLAATIISYASGNAGGVFAPSLYLGAMAGGVIGTIVQQLAPFPTGTPGAYALVGMGALFAGIIRAPMTSVFMIFEITQDYHILVPLMVANLLSFLISKRYQATPLYHALLEQDGVHLPGPESRTGSAAWRVADVMTRDLTFISADSSIAEAWEMVAQSRAKSILVGSAERLDGLLSRAVLEEAVRAGKLTEPVRSLPLGGWTYVHPDQPLDLALRRFNQNPGMLPVLSRTGSRRVAGAITVETIVKLLERNPVGAPSDGAQADQRDAGPTIRKGQ